MEDSNFNTPVTNNMELEFLDNDEGLISAESEIEEISEPPIHEEAIEQPQEVSSVVEEVPLEKEESEHEIEAVPEEVPEPEEAAQEEAVEEAVEEATAKEEINLDQEEEFSAKDALESVEEEKESIDEEPVVTTAAATAAGCAPVEETPSEELKTRSANNSAMFLGDIYRLQREAAHNGPIRGTATSPDGNYLITFGTDQTIRVYNVLPFPPYLKHIEEYSKQCDIADITAAVWIDNTTFITTGVDYMIRVWDLASPAEKSRFLPSDRDDKITALAVSPVEPHLVLSASQSKSFRVIEMVHRIREVQRFQFNSIPTAVAWSTDGSEFAVGTLSGTVMVYSKDNSAKYSFQARSRRGARKNPKRIVSLDYNSSGNLLVATQDDRIREYSNGSEINKYKGHKLSKRVLTARYATPGALEADTTVVLCPSEDGTCHVWKRGSGDKILEDAFVGVVDNENITDFIQLSRCCTEKQKVFLTTSDAGKMHIFIARCK